MTVRQAREVRQFLDTLPSGPHAKFVLADLDGTVSDEAQQALLKSLEETPEYARFILTSSSTPMATIASRCEIIRTGLLSDGHVAQVLVRHGYSEADSSAIAPAGQGQVAPALDIAGRYRPAKSLVLGVARALLSRDRNLLERLLKDWGGTEDWLLKELLAASASGKPTTLFSSTEQQLIGKTMARRAIGVITLVSKARPEMQVRALAADLMRERT